MPEEKEQKITTTIRMPMSLHKALTDEIQRRKYTDQKTSIDKAVQEAISRWLSTGTTGQENDLLDFSSIRDLPVEVRDQLIEVALILRDEPNSPEGRALKTQIKVAVREHRLRKIKPKASRSPVGDHGRGTGT